MNIVYIVDFPINGNSGKNKATREKANALMDLIGEMNFEFFYPSKIKNKYIQLLSNIKFDFKVGFFLLFKKNNKTFLVQRVLFLPFCRIVCKLKGIKVFSEFHADFKEEIELLNKNRIEKTLLKFVSYFFFLNFRLSDGIIFNHPNLKNKFDLIFKKPSIYSYNGSNTSDFAPMDILYSRKILSLSPDAIIYLFLGSVSQWHGVDYLIDIFNSSEMKDEKDVYLYIVGAGENKYVNSLKEKTTNNRIIFVPPINTEIARLYINSANFCLLPVKNIRISPGSPLKLYDYISCGKPVITQKNTLGYSDEVQKYDLGFVTDFTNVQCAVNDLLSWRSIDPEYFKTNNIKTAKQNVSWRNRMEKWLDFINLAVNE